MHEAISSVKNLFLPTADTIPHQKHDGGSALQGTFQKLVAQFSSPQDHVATPVDAQLPMQSAAMHHALLATSSSAVQSAGSAPVPLPMQGVTATQATDLQLHVPILGGLASTLPAEPTGSTQIPQPQPLVSPLFQLMQQVKVAIAATKPGQAATVAPEEQAGDGETTAQTGVFDGEAHASDTDTADADASSQDDAQPTALAIPLSIAFVQPAPPTPALPEILGHAGAIIPETSTQTDSATPTTAGNLPAGVTAAARQMPPAAPALPVWREVIATAMGAPTRHAVATAIASPDAQRVNVVPPTGVQQQHTAGSAIQQATASASPLTPHASIATSPVVPDLPQVPKTRIASNNTVTPTPAFASAPTPMSTPASASAPAPMLTPASASAPTPMSTPASASAPTPMPTPAFASAPTPTPTPASAPAPTPMPIPAPASAPMTPTVSSTQQGDTSIAPDSLQQQAEHYISTPVQANHFQSAATQRPPGTDVSPATATRTWASRIATAPAPATSTTPTSGAVTNDMPTNLLSQNGVQVLAQQGRGVSPRHATAVLLPGISSAQTADDCTAPALLASQSAVSQDGTPPQAAAEAVPNSSGDATAPIMQMMDPQLDVNSHPLLANDMPLPKAMAPMQDAPAMYPTQDVSLTTASQPSAQHTLQLQQAVFTAEHREKRRTAESSLATVQPQDASPIAGTPPAELAVGRSTGTMATATAQAATRTDAPLTAERLVQQVVSHAQVHLKGSQHEILVRLDPPELGAIHLKVTTEAGGQMVAHLEAATPMVRDLLDARLGELRQSLADAGINVNQCTVSLDMQASQQGRHSGQPGQGHTGQATMAQQPLHDTMPEEPVLHAVTARSQGAVDYFA